MYNGLILWVLWLSCDPVSGDSGVGRAEIAQWFGCTPQTVGRRVAKVVREGYVREVQMPTNRGNKYKYTYLLTRAGVVYVKSNMTALRDTFTAWQNGRILERLNEVRKVSLAAGGRTVKNDKEKYDGTLL